MVLDFTLRLGRMDERLLRIEDHKGRWIRKEVLPMSLDQSDTYVPDRSVHPRCRPRGIGRQREQRGRSALAIARSCTKT